MPAIEARLNQADVHQVANNVAQDNAAPVVAAAPPASPRARARQLLLSDLKLYEHEPNFKLINAPVDPAAPPQAPLAPVDARTAELTGADYLRAFSEDNRLLPALKQYLSGPKVLGNANISNEGFTALAERFRPVISQALHD